MNYKTETKVAKQVLRVMKSAAAAPLKKAGVPSAMSKEAASSILDNAIGGRQKAVNESTNGTPGIRATVAVNSGAIVAGHGLQGRATLSTSPLHFQTKERIRRMDSPGASLEISLPVVSGKNMELNVGAQFKVEKGREPEGRLSAGLKGKF